MRLPIPILLHQILETNQMPAKTVATMGDAEEFEFRFTPSGHGQGGGNLHQVFFTT